MRSVLRAAIVPLVAVLAAIVLMPARPATAAPTPSLSLSPPQMGQGTVSFVLTPRYVTSSVPKSVTVTVGPTRLAVKTAAAAATAQGIAPRALLFVIDASSKVNSDALAAEVDTANQIANRLPGDVAIGVIAATTKPVAVQQLTTKRSAITAGLNGIKASGGASLYDAVAQARDALGQTPPATERRIIIIGTGADNASTTTGPGALGSSLSGAGIVVDALLSTADSQTDANGLVQATGGQVRPKPDAGSLPQLAASEGNVFQPAIAVTVAVPSNLAGQTAALNFSIDGTTLAATTNVTFPLGAPPAESAPVSSALSRIPAWVGYAFAAVLFVALILAILAIIWPRSLKHERIRQISNFGPGARAAAAAAKAPENSPITSVIARTALAATASVVRTGRMEERLSRRLERAGMRMRPHEWVLLRACVVITAAALLSLAASWYGAVLGALIGWAATMLYQTVRIDRRSNKFAEQLPDALQLVIGALKSGFSLPQALESLVRESPEPVAAEFGRGLSEHRLGADISDALERVAQRAESEDLGWTVMAVRIQREVGGNLAEVLQTTVDTMRERGRLRRHVRSLSAEGRLSAYVLIGLPIFLGLFMFFYRGSYMRPLITDPLGIIMLSMGGLLFLLGIFWMTRVIKVEA